MNLKMIQFVTTSISTHPLSLFVFTLFISPPLKLHTWLNTFSFSPHLLFPETNLATSPTCLVKWYSSYKFPNVLCIPRRQLDYHTHHHHPKQEWVQTTRPTTDHVTQLLSVNIFIVVHNSTSLHPFHFPSFLSSTHTSSHTLYWHYLTILCTST